MQITGRHWVAAGIGFVVAVLAVFGWTHRAGEPAPAGTPWEPIATTTGAAAAPGGQATTTAGTAVKPLALNPADTIASWSFKGAYTGNDTLTAQADADLAHLIGLLGKGQYDDYDLYTGIANDYGLLGDGKDAYQNYFKAIAIHPSKGLAYANLGHLLDQLGAYYSAADAYAMATTVEPGMLEYHVERLTYLTRQFPTDTARVSSAFADAAKQFGDIAQVLAIEARWLSDQGRYADAIAAWERAKAISPGRDTTAIDAEIARLKAKQ